MPHEIDFLPVGDAGDSGDAITARFTHPVTGQWVVLVIDAGFKDDGDAIVEHVRNYYGTSRVDLALLTHPDGDHIGGMGRVVRGLDVQQLWLHQIGAHGGASLPAAEAVDDLIAVARERGTGVYEAWAGARAFDGALTILGPSREWYDELVAEQVGGGVPVYAGVGKSLREAVAGVWDRVDQFAGGFGVELPFAAGEVTPRNESSMVTLLEVDGRACLLTADAGTEALERALDHLEQSGRSMDGLDLRLVQVPHHGSRRNGSSATLTRLLGPTGQPVSRSAYVSCVAGSEKHPSGRIVNAFGRRGCAVHVTAGSKQWYHVDTPLRADFYPATPLGPMREEDEG